MAKLAEIITASMAGEIITLRPSLRHAIRLERRPGSFAGLLKALMDGSLTATADILRDHIDHPMLEQRILDSDLDSFKEPCIRYVMALVGMDDEPEPEPANDNGKPAKPKGKSQTFGAFLEGLYKIGTGWLGWTPETTLDATPAEIMLAHEGRMTMLRSIFGSAEDKTESKKHLPATDGNIRMAFADFKPTIVQPGA